MRKTQTLLLQQAEQLDLGDAGSESYSSNSSFTDTYSDSSELANWEEYVADDGSLFYAEYLPHLKKNNEQHILEKRIDFTRNSSMRMLNKKAARRQQQQQQQHQQHQTKVNGQTQKVVEHVEHKFSHISGTGVGVSAAAAASAQHEAYKQLELVITSADRYRYGRRSTAVESILGFRVLPFPDQPECLMVDGFVHETPYLQQQQPQIEGDEQQPVVQLPIVRGDWFKSLDDIEVRASNVNELLMQFTEPTKVCLKFQGAAVQNQTGAGGGAMGGSTAANAGNELHKIENFAKFAQIYEQLHTPKMTTELEMPFGLLILPPECYQQDQHKDSLYYYPETVQNFLYKTRGSFLTLNAVLSEELQTPPLCSKLQVEQTPYYVTYRTLNGFLVLCAYAAAYLTLPEAQLRADEFIGYMRFAFPTLNLEHFAPGNSETAVLRAFLQQFCAVQRSRLLAASSVGVQFEELLKQSRQLCLPKEAQLRIFDALSEMEAMDYRNWNDEPLTTHREFFMYGSVLYYDHWLLASQMPVDVRANVECFLRCRGIFDFVNEQHVKELYVWQEIALPNATGRYFLTVCSRSHLLLAVILKIFDAPDVVASHEHVPPSLFYIEEIQETLDHLIQCGIESLAMFWSVSNKRPEILDKMTLLDEGAADKDTNKLEAFLKQRLSTQSSTSATMRSNAFDDEAHLCSSLGGSSIHSLTPSEDDSSKKRLTMSNNNGDDSDSGSDWENFGAQSSLHYGSLLDPEAQSQMTESLWKEINNVVPVKLSAGWKNAIFYYVYVDNANGTTFCPLKANSETFPFLREMRKACHQIHEVLQETKHFRRMLAQESSKPTSSKGMLAIKEHGMTIQIRDAKEQTDVGAVKGRFVVVGRLFCSPTKEVYVCHRPDVPQNMVEMAFRLSFFSVG